MCPHLQPTLNPHPSKNTSVPTYGHVPVCHYICYPNFRESFLRRTYVSVITAITVKQCTPHFIETRVQDPSY